MNQRISTWWVVIALAVAAGCAGGRRAQAPPRYDIRTGALISANAAHDLGYAPRWSTDLDLRGGNRVKSVAILDDLLVTVTEPGNLVAVSAMSDGRTLWITDVAENIHVLFDPIRWEDSLYVNSETQIHELDPYTGELRHSDDLTETVRSGPVLVNDKAIFGSIDGTVIAHSLTTGRYRWKNRLTAPIVTPPVVAGLNVFTADTKGTYVMLDVDSGERHWQGRTFGAVTVPAAVDRNSVYIASRDTFLYTVNRITGQDRWKYAAAVPLTLPPQVFAQTVYLPVPGKGLVALDAADGTLRWTLDPSAQAITGRGDNVLVSTGDRLMLLEAATGRTLLSVPTRPLDRVLNGPDDSLILVAADGQMMRLDRE